MGDHDPQFIIIDSEEEPTKAPRKSIGRLVYLENEFNSRVSKELITQMIELVSKDQKAPIVLFIDSYGGNIDSLIALSDFMDAIPNEIHTVITGKAMSAGAYLALCGTAGKRYSFKNARIMTHELLSGGAMAHLSDQENDIHEAKKLQKILDGMVLKRTKIKKADLKKYIRNHDYYMSPDEAKELGIIDDIIDKTNFKAILKFILPKD